MRHKFTQYAPIIESLNQKLTESWYSFDCIKLLQAFLTGNGYV